VSMATRPTLAPPPPPPPSARQRPTTQLGRATPDAPPARARRSTPAQMRAVAVGLVLAGLLVGGGAVLSFVGTDSSLARADANAAQLVRLQDIQTSMVRADADVTNGFLVGGLEPVEQRQDYDAAVATAVRQVTAAARAQSADGAVLADLATSIQDYTSTIELARAANRQALPLGAQYLKNASAGLREQALPQLAALIAANEQRVDAEMSATRSVGATIVVMALVGLVGLAAAMVWLARRTHRYVNLPLATATALLTVFLVVAGVVLASVSSTVGAVDRGSYATSRALAQARIAAFDAKANESLTLVARGSGAAFEEAWLASSTTTGDQLASATSSSSSAVDFTTDWTRYTGAHEQIRAADDGGDWEGAVALAVSQDADSANAAFSAFDEASTGALTASSTDVGTSLQGARSGLLGMAAVGAVVGLLVAALAWRGIGRRIEEYR